ncbi:hypothetical protein [Endozoicomonas ascidiicola]|uniref:hypothetical protein n=1 Tax=Endozoicomonas ascidiicola TaxID=1698521 RepID=UPI0008306F45|nr:hypothetical protein [Endozoicomonas ascidiicola]
MNNPHALRFYLVLPVFEISKLINVDYNYLFTILAPVLIYIAASCINKVVYYIAALTTKKQRLMSFSLIFSILCLVSFFMNGRIIFAILAASILLYISFFWKNLALSSIVFLFFLGLFFSSVSSGTLIVYLISFALTLFYYLLRIDVKMRVIILLSFVLFYVCIYPLLSMMFFKNVDFYGGGLTGFIQMLDHGFGAILVNDYGVVVKIYFSLIVLMSCFFIIAIFIIYKWLRLFMMLIFVALTGGLFGYSTMMMVIPSITALMCFCFICSLKLFHKSILM